MSTDATTDLIGALIEHMKGAPSNWRTFAVVVEIRDGRVATTYGYTYSPDGTTSAVASRPSGVLPAVQAYLASKYTPEQELPLKMLIQFNRDSGTYEITFEDSDAARWKVTPENIKSAPSELRPEFA
jgi:hypothetical protein